MAFKNLWEIELDYIEKTASPAAMENLWVEILAGLGVVEYSRLDDLALKAQALAAEERDADLRAYLEDRIDTIVYERKRGGRR